jgi:hypothetical protein
MIFIREDWVLDSILPARLIRAFGVQEGEGPLTANGFERREEPEPNRVPPLGLVGSAALFGAGALLLFLTTRVAVPAFVSATGAETVVMWFLAASIVLFGPLLLTAALLLHRERGPGRLGSLGARLWLRAMNGGDWLWAVGGLAAVGVLTGGIGAALRMLQVEKNLHPSFMAFEPLGPGRYCNVLFGLSIVRARVFPRWTGVLLAVGTLVIPIAYLAGFSVRVAAMGATLAGAVQIWLGYDVLRKLQRRGTAA